MKMTIPAHLHYELEAEIKRLQKENDALRRQLAKDDLTGLYNARHLKQRLDEVLKKWFQEGREPALLFIDVDHFKLINETHGHEAAGNVLKELGSLISTQVRGNDIAFRYGGDEFVILVCGGKAGALSVGERIRRAVQAHTFKVTGLQGSHDIKLTVSVGTRVMQKDDSAQSVLEAADRAMFEAKRGSRNAVINAL